MFSNVQFWHVFTELPMLFNAGVCSRFIELVNESEGNKL